MAQKEIRVPLDRTNRNNHNDNYTQLFEGVQQVKKTLDDLVLESGGDSNLEVVQARGGESTLNSRLDKLDDKDNELTSQLADTGAEIIDLKNNKAEKSYVNVELQKKASLSAIENKVDKDGNEQVTWGMLDQETKENITGGNTAVVGANSVNTSNIVDNATTFNKRTRLGELATISLGGNTPPPNIDLEKHTLTFSDFFSIVVGKNRYTFSEGKVLDWSFLEPIYAPIGIVIYFNTNTENFSIHTQTRLDRTVLEQTVTEDSVLFAYIYLNSDRTKVKGVHISCDYMINGVAPVIYKNPEIKSMANIYMGTAGDKPEYNNTTKTLTFKSTFFIVHGNDRFTVSDGEIIDLSKHVGYASGIAVFYNRISGNITSYDTRKLADSLASDILIAIVAWDDQNRLKEIQISCEYKVVGEENTTDKPYMFVPELLTGNYQPTKHPACDGSDPDGFDDTSDTHTEVYAAYDELVSRFPDYITKTELGKDSSGQLPIYRYDFTPKRVASDNGYKPLPKVILVTGTHGNGDGISGQGDGSAGDNHTSVYSLYYFLKDICERWQENSVFEYLRWNIRFVIVPLVNPWGFDNRSRYNSNGVDLNRNYDFGWQQEVSNVKGTAPFSEKEAQYVRDLIRQNKDALMFVDYHTIGQKTAVPDNALIDIRINRDLHYIANYSGGKLSRMWQGKYGLSNRESYSTITHAVVGVPRPISKNWAEYVEGVPSATLESFAITNAQTRNNESIIKMNTEYIGNFIIHALQYYQNN